MGPALQLLFQLVAVHHHSLDVSWLGILRDTLIYLCRTMNQPNSALELYWYIPPRGSLILDYLIKVVVVVVVVVVVWGECLLLF